ncbi:MAG: hypothetical protein HPY82_07195 [Gammaproteobacteria bacterium]|nr:hypothetical protein [Gammaproteobacteria bacterium]
MKQTPFNSTLLFLLLLSAALFSGCKSTNPPTVHPQPPTSIAAALSFEDKLLGTGLGGKVLVTRALNDNDATSYVLRWGSNGVPAATHENFPSNFIARLEITGGYSATPYEYELYFPSLPPEELGIDSILVYTANSVGENPIGLATQFTNVIDDPQATFAFPQSVSFSDTDTRVSLAGTINFVPPANEAAISDYVVRFVGSTGCALDREPLAVIAVGQAPTFSFSNLTPPSAARSFAVIPRDLDQREPDRCAAFLHTDTSAFNQIVPSATPLLMASRVTLTQDSDETDNITLTLRVQGSLDERDLSTGYYVNVLDDSTNTCSTRLAYFPKAGNRATHTLELAQWQVPPNTTRLLVSTGTECGFTGGEPHVITLNNLRGDWHLIKSRSSNLCLRAETTEPDFPDNDGLSNHLRLTTCDAYDSAQRFTVTTTGFDEEANAYVIYRVTAAASNSCLWRRDNLDTQEWQLKKTCDGSEGITADIQIRARSNANGRRDKSMAVRRPDSAAWEYSCASETGGDRLTSGWNNCTSPTLFNFAPAGTTDTNRYAVFNDGP